MDYEFNLLAPDHNHLAEEVEEAVDRDGRWEKFIEVRMGAGPIVGIEADPGTGTGYRVSVRWGSQVGSTEVLDLAGALEAGDRLAYVFYEMRRDGGRTRH